MWKNVNLAFHMPLHVLISRRQTDSDITTLQLPPLRLKNNSTVSVKRDIGDLRVTFLLF